MAEMKETHHFHPAPFYFRFREPHYSVPAQVCVALDTVSLTRGTRAGEDTAWLQEAAAVEGLCRVAQMPVITLERTFIPGPQEAL